MTTENRDTLNAPLILVIVLAGAIFLLDLIVATSALVYNWAEVDRQRNVVNPPVAEVTHYLQDEQAKLTGYRIVDAEHQRVRIPIKRAMQLYVRRHAAAASTTFKETTP